MKKTLIALAVIGAVGAAHAESNVTVFGRLEPSFDVIKAGGTEFVTMNTNSSRIGFKGSEDVGGGFKAVFKVENNFDMVNAGGMTDARDTYVGFSSAFGTLVFGNINSAYKHVSAKYDPFDDTIGDYKTIMGMGYNNSGAVKQGDSNQRYRQTMNYESPMVGGLTVSANYALEEAKTDTVNKTAWSMAIRYDNGPLNMFAAYDQQTKNNGDTDDLKSWKVGAAYKLSFGTTVRGIYEEMKKEDATRPLNTKHSLIGVEHPIASQLTVMADYIWADDKADEAGAKSYNLGANYAFSKRTALMAVYSHTKNEANANYKNDADDENYTAKGGIIKGYSVRLQHMF